MTAARKRRIPRTSPHPYDTNNYIDVPDDFRLAVPITFADQIDAQCLDPHHCTIANALTRLAAILGILSLGPRGVSRRYVGMLLDPAVHTWAVEGQWYRARLTDDSAELTVWLDSMAGSPNALQSQRRTLKKQSGQLPEGENTVWTTIELVSPYPSEKKGYRSGVLAHGRTGSGSKRSRAIPRRQWQPVIKVLSAS